MNRLRLALVGGGEGALIGGVHRMAARLDDAYELVAAAPSADPERARRSGAAMGLPPERVHADYREMLRTEAARADGAEVVAVAVPNHLHHAVARASLDAGLHVICDKPLTTTRADAEDLQALAAARGRLLALTHNYSGYAMVRAARALVAQGALGDLRVVQVEYAQDWLALPLEATGHRQASWRTDPARAGRAGCLGDIGTHAAHLAEFISGQTPAAVSAELHTFVPGRRVDDHVQVQLRYASGLRGLLWASQVACGEANALRLRLYGSRAALHWQQEQPEDLMFTELGRPTQRLRRGQPGLPEAAAMASRLPPGHPEGFIEAFAQIYRDFADAVQRQRRGEDPRLDRVPGLAEGVRSIAFIDAVLASHAREGAWTPVS